MYNVGFINWLGNKYWYWNGPILMDVKAVNKKYDIFII